MKTYSIFCTSLTTLFNDNNLVVGNSPKAALERSINKKVKRTTDNFAIDFITGTTDDVPNNLYACESETGILNLSS